MYMPQFSMGPSNAFTQIDITVCIKFFKKRSCLEDMFLMDYWQSMKIFMVIASTTRSGISFFPHKIHSL